jgi:hypothetical protein
VVWRRRRGKGKMDSQTRGKGRKVHRKGMQNLKAPIKEVWTLEGLSQATTPIAGARAFP